MYLLYWTLCFITIILNSATSYVLLAANIEDFRTIAKKFVPEYLAKDFMNLVTKMADIKMKSLDSFDDMNDSSTLDSSQHSHEEDHSRKPKSHKKKEIEPKYEITLKYLVETVKKRLKDELKLAMESEDIKLKDIKRDKDPKIRKPEKIHSNEHKTISIPLKLQARYKKISRNDTQVNKHINKDASRPKHKKPLQDNRYLAEVFVAPPAKTIPTKETKSLHIKTTPKHEDKHNKINTKEKLRKERNTIRQTVKTTRDPISSEIRQDKVGDLFQGIDMTNIKDSYEDYVTPKKDDNYYERESPKSQNKLNLERLNDIKKLQDRQNEKYFVTDENSDKKPLNELKTSESLFKNKKENHKQEDKDHKHNKKETKHNTNLKTNEKHKNVRTDSKTTKRNKYSEESLEMNQDPTNRAPVSTTPADNYNETPIQPYSDQIVGIDDSKESFTERTQSDELKARTESLLFQENDDTTPTKQELPYSMNAKASKKLKSGTLIPKRDFYKISSPNYLAKLPIVAEKYKFDEPIPEQDREHEVLKPFGNPQASINGRVVLL